MFDLNQAIREWSRNLRRNETMEDADLVEMESFLRDEIDRQMAAGLDAEAAFRTAVSRSATAEALGREYGKFRFHQKHYPFWHPARFMPALAWNYVKVAARKMRKHKGYTFINILGLSIGLACTILICLYVKDELSYDRHHRNARDIYRLAFREERGYKSVDYPITSGGIAPALLKEVPDVRNAVRFMRIFDELVSCQEKQFYEKRIFFADESVFEAFTFPLIQGDPKTALAEPFTAVITEDMAKKYFGDADAMGRVLRLDGGRDFHVTGILKNVPPNSHFRFDLLASMKTRSESLAEEWRPSSCYTYLLLKDGASPAQFEKTFSDFFNAHRGKNDKRNFYLQPLTQIHLRSHLEREIEPNGDIAYVYILCSVAFFVLLIAGMNFMNLSTARSASRAREVGMRKVAGADRKHLILQFLGESVLLTLAAFAIALIAIELFLPVFNHLAGREIKTGYFSNPILLLGLLIFGVIVGVLAGSYPAFVISSFQPVKVLKGTLKAGAKGAGFRKVLVVVQFSLSIFMIAGTIVIGRQLDFIQNKNLGFDKEQAVVVPIDDSEIRKKYSSLKGELLQSPRIASVSAGTSIPGLGINHDAFIPEGSAEAEDIGHILIDYDFIRALGIRVKDGRDFSKEAGDKPLQAFLLNEEAAQMLGWGSPVGKSLRLGDMKKGTVIGVVNNFHFLSKHQKIDPLVMSLLPSPEYMYFIVIKIRPGSIPETIAFLKDKWKEFCPARPLNYYFLDENYEALYRNEEKLSALFRDFTGLAIFIACLGLFGLASFTAVQRTKEIGIRKVLGASAANLVRLLSLEFTRWVIVANIIAWPTAYYFFRRWLQSFAYRIGLGLETFVLAAVLAWAIALLTVGFQAVKAALGNPVDLLRYE
jgi:putative ABC transport system permease protein